MTPTTVFVGKTTREASEGLVTTKAPIPHCGIDNAAVLVDRKGPHLMAFCPTCRQYVKNLSSKQIKGAVAAPSSDRETIKPFLAIFLHREIRDRGHVETVAGVFQIEALDELDRLRKLSHAAAERKALTSHISFPVGGGVA